MITRPNCKINLGLNVLRKRSDGFHDIETLFLPCSQFCDTLEIVPADELKVSIQKMGGVDWDPVNDLTVKAWRLLEKDFGIPAVHITLTKGIPVGSGLGGGSSDAAFALRMLNEMFSLALDDEALARYASMLGSDCAFFIYNRPMLGSGRGEVLEDFPIDLAGRIEITVPEACSVNTAMAYRGITPCLPAIPLREALSMPVEQWREVLVNDFEKPVFAMHPILAEIKQQLYESGAVYASMSGSGSALFSIKN